ncbi:hypothetical protein HPB52_009974 [Rhipicephalus sanguineus]|uniref:Uncharacterized protein n=1 Tax=Rhipicephalus sanguineus TaxID=34632 RepID=A0A9D4Q5W4_RHISA|nr:hypothetical protein HPB52_009974 [Rhipicephalus sanguineus]
MASSQAILRGDHDDDEATILSLFAVQQAALRDKQAQMLRIMQQLEELEEEKEHSERERNYLAVMVARLMLRERAFRENFRLDMSTFRYIVSVCGSMARLDTNMLVRRLEPRFVRFPRAKELVEHLRQFAARNPRFALLAMMV